MSISSKLSPVPLLAIRNFPYSFLDWLRQLGNYLDNGVYTPTLTNLINVTSTVASQCQFLRVGKTVTVSGQLQLTPTVDSILTALFITIPIPTVFVGTESCGGTAAAQGTDAVGCIRGIASGQTAILAFPFGIVGVNTFSFSFTYRIT
jgi:hypothetical protein